MMSRSVRYDARHTAAGRRLQQQPPAVADTDTLRYEVTVEDVSTWTEALNMPKTEGSMYEYACHEGNYGMVNLLTGARVQEQAGAGPHSPDRAATLTASNPAARLTEIWASTLFLN